METFNPPPYREKRPQGRMPKYTLETRLQIGRKVVEKELTYKAAAKVYDLSEGAIGVCVRLYKDYKKKGDKKLQRDENNKKYQKRINNYHHMNQIKELKHQIGDLYLENQTLKKILIGSHQIRKENGSIVTTENLDQYQEDAE